MRHVAFIAMDEVFGMQSAADVGCSANLDACDDRSRRLIVRPRNTS